MGVGCRMSAITTPDIILRICAACHSAVLLYRKKYFAQGFRSNHYRRVDTEVIDLPILQDKNKGRKEKKFKFRRKFCSTGTNPSPRIPFRPICAICTRIVIISDYSLICARISVLILLILLELENS